MILENYFDRIGIRNVKPPSLEFLEELQNKHLLSIPFEDLDIPNRDRIILDLDRIYGKIIPTRRGGFCYELNGLFHWLLTQLGFKVDILSARVFNHERQELGEEFDHLTLLVHLEKIYLVDVGFGDSFRKPIELPDGEVTDVSGQYKIFWNGNNSFDLRRNETEEWKLQNRFTTVPRNFSDFKDACDFQQDSPTSHFRNTMKCSIATPTGRITLSNTSLTITENGIKTKTELNGEEEFYILLKKYFQIELL